jgi:hypothetical protein
MAERCQIVKSDESATQPNKMDQDIVSAINRVHFHHQAQAHIRIMNAMKNNTAEIMAITYQHAAVELALRYHDNVITPLGTVDKGVVDVEESESWER